MWKENESLFRPFDSYDSSSTQTYGYGGQDILLIKLIKKSIMKPICLPGPKLKDTKITGQLAGYGNYFRGACLTNSNGPMKYHYCMGETICDFKNNCEPSFSDGIKNYTGCSKEPTPARWSRLCSRFFWKSGYKFQSNVDEIHLMHISRKLSN